MKKSYSNCLFFDRYYDFSIIFISCFIIFLLILFLFIVFFVKFDFSTSYNGIVSEEDYNVVLYINDNELQSIKKYILVVDKVKSDYEIIKISDQYILSDNGPVRSVYLGISLSDSDKIVNNVIKLNFVRRMTILRFLKEMIF